jgi:glycosyltransferase involved in cell wall biosynthesis
VSCFEGLLRTEVALPAPQITVVIPVYNGEAFVADAIDSVLAQEGVAFELIVIDDGSTDATPAVLAQYGDRISVFRQPNSGEGAARNAAVAHMSGELALFLDADDLIPPGYLECFASAAAKAEDVEVFHCGWKALSFDGSPLYNVEEPRPYDNDPFHAVPYWGSPAINTLLVRRLALTRVGGFDPALRVQADLDFCLRLARGGARFRGVPDNIAIVRRRADSVSAARRRELAAVAVAVMVRHLANHERCPACAPLDQVLQLWRRKALLAEAANFADRAGLTGRSGNWMGMALALSLRPRHIAVALDHAKVRLDLAGRSRRRWSKLWPH